MNEAVQSAADNEAPYGHRTKWFPSTILDLAKSKTPFAKNIAEPKFTSITMVFFPGADPPAPPPPPAESPSLAKFTAMIEAKMAAFLEGTFNEPPADDPMVVAFNNKLQATLNATSQEYSAARTVYVLLPVKEPLSPPTALQTQEGNVKTAPAALPKPTAMTGKTTPMTTKPTTTTTTQQAPTIPTLKHLAVAKHLPVMSDLPKLTTTMPGSKTTKTMKMMPTTIKKLKHNNPPAAPDLINNNPHYLRTLTGPQLIQRARLIVAGCSPSSSSQRHKKKKAANKKSKIRFRVPESLDNKISPNEKSPSQPPSPEMTETEKPDPPKSACDQRSQNVCLFDSDRKQS